MAFFAVFPFLVPWKHRIVTLALFLRFFIKAFPAPIFLPLACVRSDTGRRFVNGWAWRSLRAKPLWTLHTPKLEKRIPLLHTVSKKAHI